MKTLIVAGLALLGLAGTEQAQDAAAWPQKQVTVVVPFGAGGSPDLVARILTERFTRLWGQQVFVENRAGVAGVAAEPPGEQPEVHALSHPPAQLPHGPHRGALEAATLAV